MWSSHSMLIFLLLWTLPHLLYFCTAKPSENHLNSRFVKGIAQVAVLPSHLKPSEEKAQGRRRLIFIGDVHGAYNELVSLLEKVNYHSKNGRHLVSDWTHLDHVVFLGDLVAKGPHSLKTVKLAMRMNASCVIGNHDYELLDWLGYIESADGAFERKAADWMLRCPFILKIGQVDGEEFIAVHAGLLPGKKLENQGIVPHYTDHRSVDNYEHAQYI